jgi:hypothetical protein
LPNFVANLILLLPARKQRHYITYLEGKMSSTSIILLLIAVIALCFGTVHAQSGINFELVSGSYYNTGCHPWYVVSIQETHGELSLPYLKSFFRLRAAKWSFFFFWLLIVFAALSSSSCNVWKAAIVHGNFSLVRVGTHLYNIENLHLVVLKRSGHKVALDLVGSGSYSLTREYQRLQLKMIATGPSLSEPEEVIIDSGKHTSLKEFPVILVQNMKEGERGCLDFWAEPSSWNPNKEVQVIDGLRKEQQWEADVDDDAE